ncbi:MAG: pyrroline-5-carboxylate reductase [Candidatus Berkiella sp.]
MTQQRIGFIGAGNMGTALIRGLINQGYPTSLLTVCDHHPQNVQAMSALGVNVSEQAALVATNVDILVLAVKPSSMKSTVQDLFATPQKQPPLLVSVAAGITTSQIQQWQAPNTAPIIRAMPNTPSLLGVGMTGLFATDKVNNTMQMAVSDIFSAVGKITWLNKESDMDIVTALSGSGPAYFFYFMECLIESAISLGLNDDIARQLTFQTALGAAQMAQQSPDSIKELRQKVTSKGGTTEQGINALKGGNMAELLQNALRAAYQRGKTLSEEYD